MNLLFTQLFALTQGVSPASGAPPGLLADLRRFLAAVLIQQNGALAPLAAEAQADPETNAAVVASVALAAERAAVGVRLRFARFPYLGTPVDAARPLAVLGPFVDADLALIEFGIFEITPLLSVITHLDFQLADIREVSMLLPRETAVDADLRGATIPAGTVWLRAQRLVPGAPGYVLLRVASGRLEFGAPATQAAAEAPIEVARGSTWRLTLVPETSPASAAGSDGSASAITLPTGLAVSSEREVIVSGTLAMAGFGSTLRFQAPSSGPVLTDIAIVFPFDVASQRWTILANRSGLAGFEGDCLVSASVWALPLTQTATDQSFEATHGGALAVRLTGTLRSTLDSVRGRIAWLEPTLTADARGIELRSNRADAAARLDAALWEPARSILDLGAKIFDLRFISRRAGADAVTLAGGDLANTWDLPRAATGEPFSFNGTLDTLLAVAEPDDLRRLALVALQPVEAGTNGLTLENLYLHVRPARQLALVASGSSVAALAQGQARLQFDVAQGEPILPDPYAANWILSDQVVVAERALSITLLWNAGGAPTVKAQLDRPITFPTPTAPDDRGDPQLDSDFIERLGKHFDVLSLLDLSTRDHHFGIALEPLDVQQAPLIDDANRLSVALRSVRLLMQPQVHWEPVDDKAGKLQSKTHGGATLVGADSAERVPALPGVVEAEIVAAAGRSSPAAALFSLPFGMRALTFMDPVPLVQTPAVTIERHRPAFDGGLEAAEQVRLTATGGVAKPEARAPDRTMPGKLHQTDNLTAAPLPNVLTPPIAAIFGATFPTGVPLHAVDLSGYGLSCFSNWHVDPADPKDETGITQVRFDVLIGRTAYEVVQARSILAPCMARVIRTIMLERRNSGRVKRFDTGWQPIDDGEYRRFVQFEKGVVNALRRIRNIRILPGPELIVGDTTWQRVRFDADADIQDITAGGRDGSVPAIEQDGYIQITAKPANSHPDEERLAALFNAVGGPIGGAIDCRARLGGTLDAHLIALRADFAPDDANNRHFAVAVYAAPTLARAGQWTPVRIDSATSDVIAVDPHRGVPVIRRTLAGRPGQRLTFCDPADAHRGTLAAPYALLFATPTSRVLFPQPSIVPDRANTIDSAPPLIADAVALAQASGGFPRAAFALRAKEQPLFDLSDANDWRLTNPRFSFDPPKPDLASGAGWSIARDFLPGPQSLDLKFDSGAPVTPWELVQPKHDITLSLPGLGPILTIRADFATLAGELPGMLHPEVVLGEKLNDLKQMITALGEFSDLDFNITVNVTAGHGPSPSFVVHLNLAFQIGSPEERIEIGIGKFYGRFDLDGEFEAALNGKTRATLKLLFQGDVQQGILPPLLYAGGLFRFGIEVRDSGDPVIELGLGTVISLGGDLIKGLLAVEATIHYGYTLIPQTLQPGVLLGIEARAKLLGGLLGLSFTANALARAERLNSDDKTVRIFAQIRVAGSVHVAWLFEKSVDFETQFEQNIPLAPLLIVAGANPLVAVAISAVI